MNYNEGSPYEGDTAAYTPVRHTQSQNPNATQVAPSVADSSAYEPEYRESANMPDAATMYRTMQAREQRRLIISTVCASLVIITTLAFLIPMFAFGNTRTTKSSRSHQVVVRDGEVEVPLYVKATNLDGNGSRIPLRISGHRPDGSSTEDACFLNYTGEGLVLTPGTYEVRVAETPIAGDGTMYALPDALEVEVTESFEVYYATDETLRLDRLSAADMTDDVISSARSWIEKDPENRDRADEFVQKAQRKREEELARERERAEAVERIATQEREVEEASQVIQEQQQNNPDNDKSNNNESKDDTKDESKDENKDNNKDNNKDENKSESENTDGEKKDSGTDTPTPTPEPTPTDTDSSSTTTTDPTPEPTPEVTPEPTPTDSGSTEASSEQATTDAAAPATETTTTTTTA